MHKSLIVCLSVLVLAASGACSESAAPDAAALTQADAQKIAMLRTQLDALRAETQKVKDANAIKRLQRAFGYYMEEALWDQVSDLFADDATLEIGRDGIYQGREHIKAYLYALNNGQQGLSEGQLTEYLQLMPVVSLNADGRTAQARWRGILLLGKLGENALWGEGPYENAYVKENGVWKFSKLHWYQSILVPYVGGWAKNEDYNKGIWVSDKLAPDAPPSHDYGSWPTTFLPPFSFPNPVGRYVPSSGAGEQQ